MSSLDTPPRTPHVSVLRITRGPKVVVPEPCMYTACPSRPSLPDPRLQEYMAKHGINELLYELLEGICLDMPDNPHQFIVDYVLGHFPDKVRVAGGGARSPGPQDRSQAAREARAQGCQH